LGPQVFNQQGGPTFHGWKDLFALQAPWAVSGPISKPEPQASGLWRLVPFHRAGGLSRGREKAATATGKKRGANRARPSTDTPLGWGGCRPGEGQWAWACLLGEEPPWREVCLVVTVTALRPVGAPAQSGLCVQEYSQGPATWPGSPRGPHHRVCVCVCVCVCWARSGPFHLHRPRPQAGGRLGRGALLCLRRTSPASLAAPAPQPPPAINGARSHFAEPGWDWDNGGD